MKMRLEALSQESSLKDNSYTMDIYCISYKRAKTTIVHKLLEYVTYVVRESQADEYREIHGDVLAVPDDLICSFAKVNNWIIENAEPDMVAVFDDDIKNICRVFEKVEVLSPEEATAECERICQIMYDLDIAYGGIPQYPIPYKYKAPFKFTGMTGPLRIYNRPRMVGRMRNIKFFTDCDLVLQELLVNRIVLRIDYLGAQNVVESNSGGNNTTRNLQLQKENLKFMHNEWGRKYFQHGNASKRFQNVPMVRVKRS